MELERILLQTIEEFAKRLGLDINNIELSKDDNGTLRANLESTEAPKLIGYHGETLLAIQHLIKLILWKKVDESGKQGESENFSFSLDVENYKKRQEENVLTLAEQKAELVRKTQKKQILPPMSPYFRRLIHIHFTQPQYKDLETVSIGEGEFRQISIRAKDLMTDMD